MGTRRDAGMLQTRLRSALRTSMLMTIGTETETWRGT